MSTGKKIVCPTCKQNMALPPRRGSTGKDCPLCGQGLSKRHKAGLKAAKREYASLTPKRTP